MSDGWRNYYLPAGEAGRVLSYDPRRVRRWTLDGVAIDQEEARAIVRRCDFPLPD